MLLSVILETCMHNIIVIIIKQFEVYVCRMAWLYIVEKAFYTMDISA